MPASCSMKKHTALPRSAHDPPPKVTTPSTPSRRACSTACCTSGTGTCDSTSAKVDASVRPTRPTHPVPVVGGEPARRRDEQRPARRRASAAAPAAGRASRRRTRSAARSRCGSRVRASPAASADGLEEVVGQRSGAPRPVADEPLGAERPSNMSSGIVRKKSVSAIWLGWAGIDARLASMKSVTSTRWVITLGRLPKSGWASKSGSSMPSGSESAHRRPALDQLRSRLIVSLEHLAMPASSAARRPTRCTWMWSGWP